MESCWDHTPPWNNYAKDWYGFSAKERKFFFLILWTHAQWLHAQYPLVAYLSANKSIPIIVPRVLASALEAVKAADSDRIPVAFQDIKADDPRISSFYADLPITPTIGECHKILCYDNKVTGDWAEPQPLPHDPLEDLDINAIGGPLDMTIQTVTLPQNGPIAPMTVSRLIMTTAKGRPLKQQPLGAVNVTREGAQWKAALNWAAIVQP
jgi:hypothetical protein